MKTKVLFVCIHNSARSQMAEAFVHQLAGDRIAAESAGLEPGKLNPLVVEAMQEQGIDISGNETNSVSEFLKQERKYDYVITVCDEASSERCPMFPGKATRMHWSFPDPSALTGTEQQKLQAIREIRDDIRQRIEQFITEMAD